MSFISQRTLDQKKLKYLSTQGFEFFKSRQFHEQIESGFRTFSEGLFTRSHVSGSIVEREWFCYSNTQGKVYCFYYKVFGTGQNSFIRSFNDWKHASKYIGSHESSPNHDNSIRIFLQRSTKKDRIDAKTLEVFESKFKYMKNVFHRAVNVAKFLAAIYNHLQRTYTFDGKRHF